MYNPVNPFQHVISMIKFIEYWILSPTGFHLGTAKHAALKQNILHICVPLHLDIYKF